MGEDCLDGSFGGCGNGGIGGGLEVVLMLELVVKVLVVLVLVGVYL